MKIGNQKVNIFKIRNRRGYAAICSGCLTEGNTINQAFDRLIKAVKRIQRKKRK